ncbi:hypothetical protein LAZ67_11001182 [Cordylochernes scorpioides]|uniref:Uncharacterized protein n=1 Tax=Cordylochernes scorpioides TaxID=51811 RepID=A0ABY6KYA5_9ARAC|nr:hypothetical protein LAZ67_11001182 [Cordylochernes scorpioides]
MSQDSNPILKELMRLAPSPKSRNRKFKKDRQECSPHEDQTSWTTRSSDQITDFDKVPLSKLLTGLNKSLSSRDSLAEL